MGDSGVRGLGAGLTKGFSPGLTGGFSGTEFLSFCCSLSMFPAPGCLLGGFFDLPGSVGIDIPNQFILPRFVVASEEIIPLPVTTCALF